MLHLPSSESADRNGITVERVLTDNGAAYRAVIHALACRALGVRHLYTRPHRPQTGGKAERLIRTMLSGWAYGGLYGTNLERTAAPRAGSGLTTIGADRQPSAVNRPSRG